MSAYLSLTDLILGGLALEVVGAYLLSRGLLAAPKLIALRARYGAILVDVPINGPQVVAEVRDRASAQLGIALLISGFSLQAVGTVLAVAGIETETGSTRAITATILALALGAGAMLAGTQVHRRLVRSALVAVANEAERYWREHKSPATGFYLLVEAGAELGLERNEDEENGAYVARIFRTPVGFHEHTKTPYLLDDTPAFLKST